jgi:asparagine synthase (glutamine-hydrolysing)
MSALAGIFKSDTRDWVNEKELAQLALGIERIGLDGGAEQISKNVGMAYRAFHTTPESHFESQPLARHGCILTWDGRLDNREDICAKLGRTFEEPVTDLNLVFAAYEEWGTKCFAELEGDWALALWDQANQSLILARDYIGVRRLFYRIDDGGIAWCTTIEPLVFTAARKLHLDLDYFAGCLYPRPPIETTPYQEIRSIVPASFLIIQHGGNQTTEQYWSLNPRACIRYSTDSEYEEHFRDVFRAAVSRRLRTDRTILAELSGGLDSSSIVCMADNIRNSDPGEPIETLSYYDTDEPGGDERPYFTLVEQRRGHVGHHISVSNFLKDTFAGALVPLPDNCYAACPGYFARSLRWSSLIAEIQNTTGSRVILSGIGGDEFLGGVQFEAPELADHLFAGRLLSFLRSTVRWSVARKKTVYGLLADTSRLLWARHHPNFFLEAQESPFPWAHLRPIRHHSALRTFARWRHLTPVQVCLESVRYSLAQQLSLMDPPLAGCAERRYPYLDRRLFEFLASIPRTQILQAGRRRHLMRRALGDIVPEGILYRTTKSFGFRNSAAIFADQEETLDALFKEQWLSDGTIVNAGMLREQLMGIQSMAPVNGLALRSALGIEHWMRSQLGRGVVDLSSSATIECLQHDRVCL